MLGKAFIVLSLLFFSVISSNVFAFSETNELLNAVERGNTPHVKQLLKSGFSVNSRGFLGATALMKAAFKGNDDMVKLLLDFGADIYVKDEGGATPLHYAVRSGNTKIVELLVKAGADVNAKDKLGFSPLKRAALGKNQDILEMLSESKYEKIEPSNGGDIAKIEDPTLQAIVDRVGVQQFNKNQYVLPKTKKRKFTNSLLNESDIMDDEVVKKADLQVQRRSVPPVYEEKIEIADLSEIINEQPEVLKDSGRTDYKVFSQENETELFASAGYKKLSNDEISDSKYPVTSNSSEQNKKHDSHKSSAMEEAIEGVYVAEAQIIQEDDDVYVPEPVLSSDLTDDYDRPEEKRIEKSEESLRNPNKATERPMIVQDLAEKARAMRAMKDKPESSEQAKKDESEDTSFNKFKVSNKDHGSKQYNFSIVMDNFKNLDLAFKFWDKLSTLQEFSSARISLSFTEKNAKEELVIVASYFPTNADAFAGCLRALKLSSGFACRVSHDY